MAVETGADLAGFFDADEFAVAATFTPSGGSGVAVTVIWETGRDVEETAAGWVNRTWRRVRVPYIAVADASRSPSSCKSQDFLTHPLRILIYFFP